jgi:carbon storage regulator CsrA
MIGQDVEIQVISVGPTQVKLGIIAPDAVTVIRKEVSATRQQNLDAARGVPSDRLATLFRRLRSGVRTIAPNGENARTGSCQDFDSGFANKNQENLPALNNKIP